MNKQFRKLLVAVLGGIAIASGVQIFTDISTSDLTIVFFVSVFFSFVGMSLDGVK